MGTSESSLGTTFPAKFNKVNYIALYVNCNCPGILCRLPPMHSAVQKAPDPNSVRFGVYEFRLDTLTLSKHGLQIRLQEQPARVLAVLLRNAGQVVTRESLKQELWPDATFGEFDTGLNTALSKVRTALGDSALRSTYIERVPKQGYRFIAPIVPPAASPSPDLAEPLPDSVSPTQPEETQVRRPVRRNLLVITAYVTGAICLVVAGLVAGRWLGAGETFPVPGLPVRFTIRLPAGQLLPAATMNGNAVALSADGTTIGYLAVTGSTTQVFVRRLDKAEFQPVAATVGASDFQLSPDGRECLFARGKSWMRTGVASGPAFPVTTVFQSQGAMWDADGAIYVQDTKPRVNPASNESFIYRIRTGGEGDLLTPRPVGTSEEWLYMRQVLPNQWILCSRNAGPHDRNLLAISLRDGSRRTLISSAMSGFVLPSGQLIYWWDGSLYSAPFHVGDMRVLGQGVPLISGVARQGWRGGQASISANGNLAYIPAPVGDRVLVWVDRKGRETPLDVPPGPYTVLGLSRNGKKLLVHRTDAAHAGVWLYDRTERTWQRLAAGVWSSSSAAWSPDEQSVAFTANLQGEEFENLYVRSLSSTGTPERIVPSPHGQFVTQWSEQGGLVYTESDRPQTHIDVQRVLKVPGGTPEKLIASPGDDAHASVSPDGRWLAWTSNVSGRSEVYARRIGSESSPIRVSSNGGSASLWSPTGKEVFYRARGSIWSAKFAAEHFEPAKELFHVDAVGPRVWNREYGVNGDGTQFLFAKEIRDPDDYRRIEVVLNWPVELQRAR